MVTATVGAVPAECAPAGVAHLLLLGRAPRAGGSNPLAALLQSAAERERAQPAREKVVATAGVPYTVLRLGAELGAPGGRQALWVGTGGQLGGARSVEDAAAVAAAVASSSACVCGRLHSGWRAVNAEREAQLGRQCLQVLGLLALLVQKYKY